MPKRVVLLISDPNCGQAQLVANAILRGYNGTVAASAYCYRTGVLYHYTVQQAAFNVTNAGQVSNHATWDAVSTSLQLPLNGAGLNNAIGQAQFDAIGGLTRYSNSMTTLDAGRIPGHWGSRAAQELGAVRAAFAQDQLCFIIAPNPRNVPVRLQTFGHKLFWLNGAPHYQKRGGGTFSVAHLTETCGDAAASLTEVALCREMITDGSTRFLGNCYGAQVMFLALGGGVTAFKRNQAMPHNQTLVPQVGGQPPLNVDWGSGITMGGRINNDPHNRAPVTHDSQLRDYTNVTYNTDYFHSCLMIESTVIRDLVEADLTGVDTIIKDHELADIITGDGSINHPEDFLARLKKYANDDRFGRQGGNVNQGGKHRRTWSWVGEYHFEGRITGLQGHPLLFLHINLPQQQDTLDFIEEQLFG